MVFKSLIKVIRFAQYEFLLAFPLLVICAYGMFFKKKSSYVYSLASSLQSRTSWSSTVTISLINIFFISGMTLLLVLAARPQFVDALNNLKMKGVDICMALDVSGSMNLMDDLRDLRPRIEIAKQEALNFIRKRPNDEFSVVVFATHALTVSPPTFDRKYLEQVIQEIHIEMIDQAQTAIGKGLMSGISRLKNSNSKSKILIFLTDGAASARDDYSIERAVEVANELGIKVYTIGIGSSVAYGRDYFGRTVKLDAASFDPESLQMIAKKTGGLFFHCKNGSDLKSVYDTIDRLEKIEKQTDIFEKYQDIYLPLMLTIILLLLGWAGLRSLRRVFV